jgi:hypothetical protein
MTVYERAAQIWPLLSYAARHRQTLTYDILGKLIGVPRFGLGKQLEPIQSYCLIHNLPPLTVLVVNQSGRPSEGFIAATTATDVLSEQERAFGHDWLEDHTPTSDELRQAAVDRPSCGVPEAATPQVQ